MNIDCIVEQVLKDLKDFSIWRKEKYITYGCNSYSNGKYVVCLYTYSVNSNFSIHSDLEDSYYIQLDNNFPNSDREKILAAIVSLHKHFEDDTDRKYQLKKQKVFEAIFPNCK